MIKKIIKQLFCRHRRVYFYRNIYGDEINEESGFRSWHRCINCGKLIKKKELYKS